MNHHYQPNRTPYAQTVKDNASVGHAALWAQLKSSYPKKFLRRFPISQYILDFYCPELNLAISVTPNEKMGLGQISYVKQMDKHLKEQGIKTLHFKKSVLSSNLDSVIGVIEEEFIATQS